MTMLAIKSRRVVTQGSIRPACVITQNGVITAIADHDYTPTGAELYDAGEFVVMPGVVDTHVHVNEPGRTEWEGFTTATAAAAAGGITTLVDMPLNSIPATTTQKALLEKRRSAEGKCRIDVGFWGGVVPGNQNELAPMAEAGALGFKCFLIESGVDEFQSVTRADLEPAMQELARIARPLLVHAEVSGPIDAAQSDLKGADPRKYETYLRSRPRAAEDQAIALLIALIRKTRARSHIVHHSSMDALSSIRAAKQEGLPLTAETCPHYLHFAAEEIPDGRTEFKCAPPIRERDNREALWAALGAGLLDLVASDHSPCSPGLKKLEQGLFDQAWGGVSGLQLALSVTWTEASRRGYTLIDLVKWMCEGPARLASLTGRKGVLAQGADADLTIFDPDKEFTVDSTHILHKHKVTPYLGQTLRGQVRATYLRGQKIYDGDEPSGPPRGKLL